jgi:hypothetical protein
MSEQFESITAFSQVSAAGFAWARHTDRGADRRRGIPVPSPAP